MKTISGESTEFLIKALRWCANDDENPLEANLALAAAERLEKLEAQNAELLKELKSCKACKDAGLNI